MEAVVLVFTLIGLIVALFWIALPFLVYGTNNRRDELSEEVRALRGAVERQESSVSREGDNDAYRVETDA